MSEIEKIYILNLIGELDNSLVDCFTELDIVLIERQDCKDYQQLSYILVDSEEEQIQAYSSYSADQYEINFICIGEIKNVKNFLIYNGKLILENDELNQDITKKILKNFLYKQHTIHIDQDFNEFNGNIRNINITNHLSAGHYIDQLTLDAFENGHNIVPLRSFLDHSIYYITYLKQVGLAGVPIEIDYSNDQNNFILNIHVSVNEFVSEYLIDSFGDTSSDNPIHFLMTIIKGISDFLELIYFEDSNKLVIRGLWFKDINKLKGFTFNNILSAKEVKEKVDREYEEYKDLKSLEIDQNEKKFNLDDKELPGGFLTFLDDNDPDGLISSDPVEALNLVAIISTKYEEDNDGKSIADIEEDELDQILSGMDEDLVSKISVKDKKQIIEQVKNLTSTKAISEKITKVKGQLEEDDDFKKTLADKVAEDIAQKVSGKMDEETINKVTGNFDEEDENITVKGGKEAADDFQTVVSGEANKEKGNFIAKFSNGLNEEMKKSNFSSGTSGKGMEFRNLISSTMSNLEKDEKINPHFKKFVSNEVSEKYAKKLEAFANSKGMDVKSIAKEEVEEFNKKEIPALLQAILEDKEQIEEFKNKIENNEIIDNKEEKLNKKLKKLLKQKMDELNELKSKGQEVDVQKSIKEVIKQEVSKEITKSVDNNSKDDVITSIAKLLPEDEEISKQISESFKNSEKEKKSKVLSLIKSSANEEKSNVSTSNTYEKDVLVSKLKESSKLNKQNEDKIKALTLQLESLKEAEAEYKETKDKIDKEVEQKLKEIENDINDSDILETSEKEKLLNDLENGTISSEDSEKLANSIKKEALLIDKAKEANSIIKKMNIEINQKEAIFKSELNKAKKIVKAKDLVVEKAKSTMRILSTKASEEKKSLNNKIIELNQRLSEDKSQEIKEKLQKAMSANKELLDKKEMLEAKIDSIEKSANNKISKVESRLSTENKHELDKLKNKIKNIANQTEKEKGQLKKQLESAKESEINLKEKTVILVNKLKEFEKNLGDLKTQNQKYKEQLESGDKSTVENLEVEVNRAKEEAESLKKKVKEMAERLKDAEQKVASAGKNAGSAKEKKLEKDLGRLRVEMSKIQNSTNDQRKELLKLKGENTALKNKLKKFEKGKKVA